MSDDHQKNGGGHFFVMDVGAQLTPELILKIRDVIEGIGVEMGGAADSIRALHGDGVFTLARLAYNCHKIDLLLKQQNLGGFGSLICAHMAELMGAAQQASGINPDLIARVANGIREHMAVIESDFKHKQQDMIIQQEMENARQSTKQ